MSTNKTIYIPLGTTPEESAANLRRFRDHGIETTGVSIEPDLGLAVELAKEQDVQTALAYVPGAQRGK